MKRTAAPASSIEILEARIAPAFGANLHLELLNGGNGFRIENPNANPFGDDVSMAGDINGDGFGDFVVGNAGQDNRGSISVIFGHAGGFSADISFSTLDGTNGFRLDGEPGDFADHVTRAGDVNGDGFDDLLIGARGKFRADYGDYNSDFHVARPGRCYIVFGHAADFAPVVNLGSLNGSDGFRIVDHRHGSLGEVVGSAGDINGDGFDDVVIGDSVYTFVLFGKAGGFAASRKFAHLTDADGFGLRTVALRNPNPAGDVNGDGFDDLIIGSSYREGGPGLSFVVYGKASSFGSFIRLEDLDGTDGFSMKGGVPEEYAGAAVSGAGDVNGDGFADLLIGAPGHSYQSPESRAYVVFGKAGVPPVVELSTLDGTNGFRLTGLYSGRYFDYGSERTVAGLGDFNGDGFGDLLLGSFSYSYSGYRAGAVVFGHAGAFPPSFSTSQIDGVNGFRLISDGVASYAHTVSGGGDINGDGRPDLILSVDDVAYVVFGGAGNGILTGHRSATFFDADGDIVTLKTTRGSLTADALNIIPDGTLDGGHFAGLDLTHGDFAGASVTLTARRGPAGGDGLVDLGFLNAAGIDLGKVTIDGDLGRIDAGDNDPATPALISLRVHSMGLVRETPADPAAHESHLIGGVGQFIDGTAVGGLRVRDSIRDSALHIGGDLARLIVGGDFADSTLTVRGDYFTPDRLTAQTIAAIRIGGDIDHSQLLIGYNNGGLAVNSEVQIGTVTVGGDWIASDLAVGGETGADGHFGTEDDRRIGDVNSFAILGTLDPGGTADDKQIHSRIASVIIAGRAIGTAGGSDHFGIVAEEIARVQVGGAVVRLRPGAGNDTQDRSFDGSYDGFKLGSTGDVTAREF